MFKMKKLIKNKKIILVALIIAIAAIVSVILVALLNKSEYRRCSIKSALAELENYQFGEYDNIKYDCTPLIPSTDEFYSITADFNNSHHAGTKEYDKILEMANKLLGVTEFSSDAIIHTSPYCAAIYDYSGNFTATLYTGGTFSFDIRDIELQIFQWDEENKYDQGEEVKHYNVFQTGIPDEYFTTYDGKQASIKKVVENADKFINENMMEYLSGVRNEELVLENIVLMESAVGNTFCVLNYTYQYDGLLLNSYGYISDVESIRCPVFTIAYSNETDYFSITNSMYDGNSIIDSEKIRGLVYPLSSAEQMVSDKLAPLKKYTVTEVSLRNVCISPTGSTENIYRPMWVFVLEDKGVKFYNERQAVVAFVDLKTGDFYAYDTSQYMSLKELESH